MTVKTHAASPKRHPITGNLRYFTFNRSTGRRAAFTRMMDTMFPRDSSLNQNYGVEDLKAFEYETNKNARRQFWASFLAIDLKPTRLQQVRREFHTLIDDRLALGSKEEEARWFALLPKIAKILGTDKKPKEKKDK